MPPRLLDSLRALCTRHMHAHRLLLALAASAARSNGCLYTGPLTWLVYSGCLMKDIFICRCHETAEGKALDRVAVVLTVMKLVSKLGFLSNLEPGV